MMGWRSARWVAGMVILAAGSALGEVVTRRWGTPPAGPPAAAKAAPPRAKPPTCYAPRAAEPPKLDGKLEDACWRAAGVAQLARTLDGTGPAGQPTEVRLARDEKNLYVAFRCTEPLLDKLDAPRREHDGPIWEDDSIELFLSPKADLYFHLGASASGSTYDAQAKDKGWNGGIRAAAGREQAAWTVELAIPIAPMAGEGKVPTDWTANFNRNRRTTGGWEETAWSPTFSGDSHVPGRFGRLLLAEPPKEAAEPAAGPPPAEAVKVKRPSMEVMPAENGPGVVRFDLSDLPAGVKVHRADLLVFRTVQVDGRMEESRVDIEIYPLFGPFKSGGRAEVGDAKPLALRAPWFDRFDATAAVQAWAAGKPNGGFFVKACPFWNAAATCLDVAYEGKPDTVPPQVTGLRAFHRAGQTFLSWRETEEPVGRDEIAWGELRTILDGLDAARQVRYVIYRHTEPIAAANLHQAERIAIVRPLSCWNVEGRNIDRPVDEFIAANDVLMTGHWNPFREASLDGRYGRDCPIERFVMREGEGPLARGTGLYVHAASQNGRAFYAVVTCVDGVENTLALSAGNSLEAAVEEAPGDWTPVLQGELPGMPFFNYDQKRLHYVRWLAPPLANLPYRVENLSVGVPNDLGNGVPLELSLHQDGHSYWRTQYRIERDSIVLCPYDFPMQSWWHGYHESAGTLRSFRQGAIHPYTERRLLSLVEWACRTWPVDRSRVLATGCGGGAAASGALRLGLRRPEVFSLVIAGHPVIDYADACRRTDRGGMAAALSMQAIWGRPDWDARTPEGRSFWAEQDLNAMLAGLPPRAELPFLSLTSSHTYEPCRRFYAALLDRRTGVMADFWWGGAKYVPISRSGTYPNVIRLETGLGRPYLAFASAQGRSVVQEGKMGDFNRQFRWSDVVDEPGRFEATVFLSGRGDSVADVTPRRLAKFRPAKGAACPWRLVPAARLTSTSSVEASVPKGGGDKELQQGTATVDEAGLVTVKGVGMAAEPRRLVVTIGQ